MGGAERALDGGRTRISPVNRLPDGLGTRPVDPSIGEDTAALQAPAATLQAPAAASQAPAAPSQAPAAGDLADVRERGSARPETQSVSLRERASRERLRALWLELRWPLAVYGVSRLVLLATAIVETFFRRWTVWGELSNWDGQWYLRLLTQGYPNHVTHTQTPLGFLPLYPMLAWLPAHLAITPNWRAYEVAGLFVSLVTGAVAVVLIGRLATDWWGTAAGRRAVMLFCFFPGTVVFSMVYTEGLLLVCVAGCLLAMQRRRWLVAGTLAALSTAVGPVAVAVIPACAVSALVELWRKGWRDPEARRALIAPLMAPLGLIAFGLFLWLHAGTPMASYETQRYGWEETSTPLALLRDAEQLFRQAFPAAGTHPGVINANYIAGLIGAAILLGGLVLLVLRPRVPLPTLVWTLGVAVLTVTSAQTPPNARLLLCAFPAVIVYAQRLRGRWFNAVMVLNCLLFVGMSWFTFVGVDLRP